MSTLPSVIVLNISSSAGTVALVATSSINAPAINSSLGTVVALPSTTAITASYAASATSASFAATSPFSGLTGAPTLVSGSSQIVYSNLTGIPADIFLTGSHSTSNIAEGSKLFYTDARVKTKLNTEGVVTGSSQIIYGQLSGIPADIFLTGSHSTTNISEGSKLFYTDARVKSKLDVEGVVTGSSQIIYSGISGIPGELFKTGSNTTSDIIEGSKLFYTDARVKIKLNAEGVVSGSSQVIYGQLSGIPADIFLTGSHSTTNITEGSKLFFTSARVKTELNSNTVVSGSSQILYSGLTGVPADIFRTGSHTTSDITEGTKLFYTDVRVKTKLNADGVVSSSSQILYSGVTGVPGDLFRTGSNTTTDITEGSKLFFTSARVKTELNSNTVISSSAQVTIPANQVTSGSFGNGTFLHPSGSVGINLTSAAANLHVSGTSRIDGTSVVRNIQSVTGNLFEIQNSSGTALASISASGQITAPTFVEGGQTLASKYVSSTGGSITGSLVVTGTLTAAQFNTTLVSSSIIYQSGSTKFGDTFDDVMSVTGSLQVSGSMTVVGGIVGNITTSTSSSFAQTAGAVDYTNVLNKPTLFSSSLQVDFGTISNKPTLFSGSAQVLYSGITGVPGDLFRTGSNSTTDITEGSKLFFTSARVKTELNSNTVVSSSAQVLYSGITGVPGDLFRTGSNTTTDITEGSKLFYTDVRVKTKLNTDGVVSSSSQITYSGLTGIPADIFRTGSNSTTDITEGSKLFFTSARVKTELNSNTVISSSAQVAYGSISGVPGDLFKTGSNTTTDITEGSKLFFTSARVKTELNTNTVLSSSVQVRSMFSGSGIIVYDPNTGIFSATGGGTGTVTSVGIFTGAGISVSGSAINNSGSFLLTNTGVLTVAGRSGSVTLTAADIGAGTYPAGDYVVNGVLTANSLVETSTRRKKRNITPISSQIELIKRLKPSEFIMKDTGRLEKGLIAEEVAEVYPEFVAYEEIDGKRVPSAVNYSKMVTILIQAVQEMDERIKKLETPKRRYFIW